jgi:hypothetical protein
MDMPFSSLQSLAQRLLSLEAENSGGDALGHGAVRVCEKFRVSLTRFAGPEAFASLMRRSLALARADAPSLEAVTLNANGSLAGLEGLASETRNGESEAVVEIIAHLLGLLVTFIGEPLTLRIVHEWWPEVRLGE